MCNVCIAKIALEEPDGYIDRKKGVVLKAIGKRYEFAPALWRLTKLNGEVLIDWTKTNDLATEVLKLQKENVLSSDIVEIKKYYAIFIDGELEGQIRKLPELADILSFSKLNSKWIKCKSTDTVPVDEIKYYVVHKEHILDNYFWFYSNEKIGR